jgi:hypothetical protein
VRAPRRCPLVGGTEVGQDGRGADGQVATGAGVLEE